MNKPNKKRNPMAKFRHFKNKVIKNKRLYDRKKSIKIHTEIVNGICPTCKMNKSVLVGINTEVFIDA